MGGQLRHHLHTSVPTLRRYFMTPPLIDAHCHLHDERLWSIISPLSRRNFDGVLSRARNAHVSHVVSCATHEQDWRALERLIEQEQHDSSLTIVPAFGFHPWWAGELSLEDSEGLEPLKDTLARHPGASVGEIGLCKSARGRQVPIEVQVAVFQAQLALAAELGRTCVLHCVGYYGKLLEILLAVGRRGSQLPPALVFHSYSGPPDMMRSFLALPGAKVFFSLNAKQLTDPQMKKAVTCCKELPLEALLLETDAPDQAPSVESTEKVFDAEVQQIVGTPMLLQKDSAGINEPALMKLALESAAKIREVTTDELAVAVYQNCKEAFGLDGFTPN
ncbi:TatD related DNase [Phytophthora cinnamomi]|uniref:TatD related DNase n=1 Tax=Phytophthora cinnamomi TaxID=4785 RepID=UPI003559C8EF|nr:TatD related DNase [Phytophthora cinnamomi]